MSVDIYIGDKKYSGRLDDNWDYVPMEINEAQSYLDSFREGQAYTDAMNITNNKVIIELSTPIAVVEVIAPYQKDVTELGKNFLSGAVDAGFGAYVIESVKDTKKSNTRVPALGVAANFETVTVRSEVQALKGISKFLGPVAVIQTFSDIKEDFEKYEGNDRYWAAGYSLAGAGTSAIVGGSVAAVSTSFLAPIAIGAIAGWGINKYVGQYKDNLQKKQNEGE